MKHKDVITSISNPQMKNLTLLQKKAKARKEQGLFVIEGLRMFEEAKEAGILDKVYSSESFFQTKVSEQADYFNGLNYELVSNTVFKDVSDTMTPQGIIATVKVAEYSLEDILKDTNAFILLLEDIRDPGNLGTIIRTAEGAGITGIIVNKSCVDIYNPKVVRSTMGSIYRVPYYQAEDYIEVLQKVKVNGIEIFAAHLNGKSYDIDGSFIGKCAFIIGNEANGLTAEVSDLADTLIRIPMYGKVESLNAAVAASILMYEGARQRRRGI